MKNRMTVKSVLRSVYRNIKPENWTQRVYARDASGDEQSVDSAFACKWCAMGHVYRTIGIDDEAGEEHPQWDLAIKTIEHLKDAAFAMKGFSSVPDYNDYSKTTYKDVRAMFRRAYTLAGGSRA